MRRFIVPVFILAFAGASAFATTVERLTFDDLVRKAHTIVHGKVRGSRTHWSANGRLILTTTTIDVAETIKGTARRSVELTTIGGRIGDLVLYVSGMPAFRNGEEAVVFVEQSAGLSTIVGLGQGKFSVEGGQVANSVSELAFPDGRAGGAVKMRFTEFKRQIQNRLR